jgi:ubiquinone/menaquinone biosynthesis C-methylase UbiE
LYIQASENTNTANQIYFKMKKEITDVIQTQSGEILEYIRQGENEFLQTEAGIKYRVDDNIIFFLNQISLTGNNEKYQKMYDRFAGYYDFATKLYALLKGGSERKRVMQYLQYLNINNHDKVIEISIGTGRNIKYLNSNAEYYGVDISTGMLKKCQRKMKRLKREIILLQAEAEYLPIKDATFDVVFSAGGFNFFNDPGKAVNEMLRIAKSGAKLLIYDETEAFRLKHIKNDFYKGIEIKNPVGYLPDFCRDIEYKEICDGDLYILAFQKS